MSPLSAGESVNRFAALPLWMWLARNLLEPDHPFEVHQRLYERVFAAWDPANGPAPAWFPEDPDAKVVVVEKDRVLAAEDDIDLVAASLLSWTI